MWPKSIDWKKIRFGVEMEFVGGDPESLELLPGWVVSLDERQIDETGEESGSEIKPPPLLWEERDQIRVMLDRLHAQGAWVNWSCGLHVHIDLEAWGQEMILPLLDAALLYQETMQSLLQTSPHRTIYCPPVKEDIRKRYVDKPSERAVLRPGRPQSHRCGINTAAWFDIGTVEIRYANGSLNEDEIMNTIEFCLRFVAAIGEGRKLTRDPRKMAIELGAPVGGYPAPIPIPRWYQERLWLEDGLIPAVKQLAGELVKDGEILQILPVPDGILIAIEDQEGKPFKYVVQPPSEGWKMVRQVKE
ncbi:amidoligase family protein [Brevibacillus invocatus]|nr:amidoligase family protein [Brevibacillus invocatus]